MVMRRMPNKFRAISDIIESEKEFGGIRKFVKEQDVIDKFEDILPDIIKISEPKKVSNKILFLRVENSVYRNELNLIRGVIIEKINKYFGEEVIVSLKFIK